jgi:hypothetical protein
MLQFSLLNGGVGLLVFSPFDVIQMITTHFSRHDAMNSNTSILILSLATSLTKTYSNPARPDISPQIAGLVDHITNSLLPPVVLPEHSLPPEILEQPLAIPFREITTSNPELLFQYDGFLMQTIMSRYSSTWTHNTIQRVMLSILVALGIPEGGMSFQGAVDFLVRPLAPLT